MSIPFFLKPKRDKKTNYAEIEGVKFFVLSGKPGSNCLFAAEQTALDNASDKFVPGFSLVATLARTISEQENIKVTEAYDAIINADNEPNSNPDIDYAEIRIKYGAELAELNVQLDREVSAKKIAVVTVAIANRCYQYLEDEMDSFAVDDPHRKELYKAITDIQTWTTEDTSNKLSQGYIDEVYKFLEIQRNGGIDPAEAEKPSAEDLKKGSEKMKQTGQKSSGESKNIGVKTEDSVTKTLVANQSG